ncbi:MAG: amino acid permease, partial [Acidobacteriota bacterium]
SLGRYGGISIVGWLISAGGASLMALVFARLSRMVRDAGGPYAFTRQGFGEFPGFLVAWGYWISIWTTNAALAVAFVSYLTVVWPTLETNGLLAGGVAVASIWLLTWLNALGVRKAGMVQLVTTILKLIPLAAIATFGLLYVDIGNFVPFNASEESSFSAVTATVTLTLWAFLGIESGTIPSDDVEDPRRTIPRATLLGTLCTSAVYILGTVAVMGVVPSSGLATSTAPFADAAREMWGSWAGYAVGIGAAISCFGALNGWLLLQGQIPLAAARDGLFPRSFGRLSKNNTPALGLVMSSVLATLLMAMNYTKSLVEQFTFIILLATLNTLVPYVFSTMAELMIFVRDRERFRDERLSRAVVVAVLAFLYSLWAIAGAGQEIVYWGFLLLLAGVPVYVWIKWHRSAGGSAGVIESAQR